MKDFLFSFLLYSINSLFIFALFGIRTNPRIKFGPGETEKKTEKMIWVTYGCLGTTTVAYVVVLVVVVLAGATLDTDIGPDSEAQIHPDLHDDELDGQDNGEEHIDTTQQSEEATPPVTDKLEAQKKADLKKSAAATAAAVIAAGNGQQQAGIDAPKPPNTSV